MLIIFWEVNQVYTRQLKMFSKNLRFSQATRVETPSGCREKQRVKHCSESDNKFMFFFSALLSVDDEHFWYNDGHTSRAPQELQHQNVAGPHCGMGSHFQHRYKNTKSFSCAL